MNAQTLLFILRVQDQASGALSGVGSAVATVAVAMGAAAVAASKVAVEFDRAMTQMQTLAGVTANEVEGLTESIKRMAADTGRGPQDLAGALYFVSSSGFETAEAMKAVEAAAKGSAIGLGETKLVADVITSAMNAYGHANLEAADATGILAKAIQLGKIEADQLAMSIGQVIPNAAMAGVSFNDAAAAMAGMSLAGINAARGGTMVRQTLQDIIAPSEIARKHLADMGIELGTVQKIFSEQGYLEGITYLRQNLGELDLRKVVNDAEAFTGIMALTGENADKVREIFEQMRVSGEQTLEAAYRIAQQSDAFSWDQQVTLLKLAVLDLGQLALPLVLAAMNALTSTYMVLRDVIVNVSGFISDHSAAFTAAAVAVAAYMIISALPAVLLAVGSALTVATVRLAAWTVALRASSASGFAAGLASLGTALVLAGQAAVGAAVGVKAFTLALLTNPIFLAVAALTALGGILYYVSQNSEQARHAQQLQAEQQRVLAQTSELVTRHAEALAAATDANRAAAVRAAQADANLIQLRIARQRENIKTAQTELMLARATAAKGQEQVVAAMRSSRGAGGGSDPGMIAINRNQPNQDAAAAAKREYDAKVALLKGQEAQLAELQGTIRAYTPPKAPAVGPPPRVGGAAGAGAGRGAGGGAGGGVSDAEREETRMREAIESTVEALRIQAAQYTETAAQADFLDSVRRANIKTIGLEQDTIEKGLAITDAQAKASTQLNGIREIARAVQAKTIAEQAEQNRQLDIEAFAVLRLVDAYRLSARERAIETAVIEAQTDAAKKKAVFDEKRVREDAGQKFDAGVTRSQIDAKRAFDDSIASLDAQRASLSMNTRSAAIYVAGEEARIRAIREGNTAVDEAVRQAQVLTAAQYDLENRQRGATEGVRDWMEDLQKNTLSMGDVIYEGLGATVGALSSVFDSFWDGQKVGWREMARGVISQIGKMITQMLLMKAIMAGMKFLGFADGGLFGGGKLTASVNQTIAENPSLFARGAAFASGGTFTNQIVDAITAFQFNEGNQRKLGVMGEAGPEAIMPLLRQGNAMAVAAYAEDGTRKALELQRGPGGALGVKLPRGHERYFALGGVPGGSITPLTRGPGGGGGGIVLAPTLNADFRGMAERNNLSPDQAASASKALEGEMLKFMERWVGQEQRPGGRLAMRR